VSETETGRKIKVLVALHDLSITGAPKSAVEAFGRLKGQLDMRIIALRNGPLGAQAGQIAPLLLVEKTYINSPADVARGYGRRYRRWRWAMGLRRWKPDVIYANSIASLPLFRYMALPDAPILLHVHEMHSVLEIYGKDDAEALRCKPTRYIAVSEATRGALKDVFGIPPEKVSVVHACFFKDGVARAEAGYKGRPASDRGRFVVGGSGRLQWRKGFELWLQTAATLRDRHGPDAFRFVWVGGERDAAEIEFRTTVRKLGLESCVELVPMSLDPYPHFCRFDAFLTTAWEDSCPAVVLESMALGKPVLCVEGSGGAGEEIGDTGVIVPRFDAALLADALTGLRDDPERTARLGRAARERVYSHFTPETQTPKILAEIERLAAMAAGTAGATVGAAGG
jgi:glycosyltransferase involved in cell wall biosynthesis